MDIDKKELEDITAWHNDNLKKEYIRACQMIAQMHEAAVGYVGGPKRGVVEDVEDLRLEKERLQKENAILRFKLLARK